MEDYLFPDLKNGSPDIKEITRAYVETKHDISFPEIAIDMMLKARGITVRRAISEKRNVNLRYLGTIYYSHSKESAKFIKKQIKEENDNLDDDDPNKLNNRQINRKAVAQVRNTISKSNVRFTKVNRNFKCKNGSIFKIVKSDG